MFKQRLKQREQDHLDQIMILKKSLEKKVSFLNFAPFVVIHFFESILMALHFCKYSVVTLGKNPKSNAKL